MNVSVQVFSVRESESGLVDVLRMWEEQRHPSWADVDVYACVGEEDAVTYRGRQLAGVDASVLYLSGGKLDVRNRAHAIACSEGADVIVSAGADAPPLHDGVLSSLVSPMRNPGIVGVDSRPVSPGLYGTVVNTLTAIEETVFPHMSRQCSAFKTDAWKRAGPFKTSGIDQREVSETRSEEEHEFRRRLERYGTVVKASDARVLNQYRFRRVENPTDHPLPSDFGWDF